MMLIFVIFSLSILINYDIILNECTLRIEKSIKKKTWSLKKTPKIQRIFPSISVICFYPFKLS